MPKFGAKLTTIAFSDKDISKAVTRITHGILEKNKGAENLTLIGIRTRGVTLAKRIKKTKGINIQNKIPELFRLIQRNINAIPTCELGKAPVGCSPISCTALTALLKMPVTGTPDNVGLK